MGESTAVVAEEVVEAALAWRCSRDRDAWKERAACRASDPAVFYPERGESCREAKEICAGCPVRTTCLAVALVNGEKFGIWGGLGERQRRRLRPALARAGGGDGRRAVA